MHKFLQLFSEPIINQVVAIYLTEIDIFLSIISIFIITNMIKIKLVINRPMLIKHEMGNKKTEI